MLEAGGFEPQHDNGLPVEELGFWKRQYIFAAATMPAGGKGSVRLAEEPLRSPQFVPIAAAWGPRPVEPGFMGLPDSRAAGGWVNGTVITPT